MDTLAGNLVRSSRRRRNLTQGALASRSGVQQPNIAALETHAKDATITTVERLLAVVGDQLAVLPTREATATDTADHIARLLADKQAGRAYRAVLAFHDGLVRSEPATRVALVVTPPSPIGAAKWDALLAGVVEYDLARLPIPKWVDEPGRVIDGWYVDERAPQSYRFRIRANTPKAFRRHGVWLDKSELASV